MRARTAVRTRITALVRKTGRVRLSRLLLTLALVPLLGGCSVVWKLAATKSSQNVVIYLPHCSTESIQRLDLARVDGWQIVWETKSLTPAASTREFVVGESPDNFTTVVPLDGPLDDGVEYDATIYFSGTPGPFAEVRFKLADLSDGALWSNGALRTTAQYESTARHTGLCGASDFSLKELFWSKFGVGCAIALLALTAFGGFQRRQMKRRQSVA